MNAVTWLFVPGDRPERFSKAQASGADAVVCDLEDGVAPRDKAQARDEVRAWLAAGGRAWVRVNAPGSEMGDHDVAALKGLAGLQGLMVPKCENAGQLEDLGRRGGGCPLVALVETAAGMLEVGNIARSPAVDRLAFGSIDYAGDIDAVESDDSLLLARSLLVVASRAAGKPGPLDGVTTDLLTIEPVEAEASAGAVAVAGHMVDRPVLERARRILSRVESTEQSGQS
jgi:citrate lyase subunit beta/citryl-CoA lyase